MVAGRGGRAWGTPEPVASPRPSPNPRSQPLVSHPPAPQSSTTTTRVKKSDHAWHWQLLGSAPRPPPCLRPPPGPRRVPAPPALILSFGDSHHCAGGLTAEATGPPPPSASQRERDLPGTLETGRSWPSRSAASRDHAGFRESSCAAASRSEATRESRAGETSEAAPNSNNSVRLQFHLTSCPMKESTRACLVSVPHLDSPVARVNSGVRRVPPCPSGATGRGRGLGVAGVGGQGGQ